MFMLSCGTYLSCLTDIYMLKEQFDILGNMPIDCNVCKYEAGAEAGCLN